MDTANGKIPVHEQPADPTSHTTLNTSEIEEDNQPAEADEETEADRKEANQEDKGQSEQTLEYENNNKEVSTALHPQQQQQQQDAVINQEDPQHKGETCGDSVEPEDEEQVETFFSTMSHRYENATQEGHIL